MLKLFTTRMSEESVDQLTEIAKIKHLPMRTMLRSWILERIEQETIVTPAHANRQVDTCAGAGTQPLRDAQ